MNKAKHQHGFSPLIIVLVIVALGIIGFVAWRVYDSTTQANNSLNNAAASSNTEPIKDKKDGVATKKIVIPYIDYEIEVSDSIKDLTFNKYDSGDKVAVQVSTKTLTAIDPECAAEKNEPLGMLVKGKGQHVNIPEPENSLGILVKQFSDYYVSYYPYQAACSDKADAIALQQDAGMRLQKALGISSY